MNNPNVEILLKHCNAEERQQVMDTLAYLTEVAQRPSGASREGSVASIINAQPPKVREVFRKLDNLMETPRIRPFDQKLTEQDHAALLGLDPDISTHIKSALDGQEVLARTMDRMGTDADRPEQELNMRDHIAAALTHHEGSTAE